MKHSYKKHEKGITLIALIITIIILLILAGVSMNAVFGDSGIITKAQEGNMKSGMAALEEFLQEKYIENYESFNNDESKVVQLENLYPEYFYIPANEGVGSLRYIVDSEGHALYLIKKSGLPDEIREQLSSGNAGEGTYTDYASLNDVYGVTSDLKVYYSGGSDEELLGISKEQLDEDNPARLVFNAGSAYAKLINGNAEENLTAQDCKAIKSISIDSTSGINNLSELYNFTSLQELTLKDFNNTNLEGIQNIINLKTLTIISSKLDSLDGLSSVLKNLNYVSFSKSCEIGSYYKLSTLTNLKYLYLCQTTNNEIEKLCSADLGIKNAEFSKLTYFGILGSTSVLSNETSVDNSTRNSKVTDISGLNNLTNTTKNAIQYLFVNNNAISSILALKDFKNVIHLHCETNYLTTLEGMENMIGLTQLYAGNNLLGSLENAEEKDSVNDGLYYLKDITTITRLDLRSNKIIWIDYIKNNTNLNTLYIQGMKTFNSDSLIEIKTLMSKRN